MKKLSQYRWITLIMLAIICQLIVSRVAESSPLHSLSRDSISKHDRVGVNTAPHNPYAGTGDKTPEPSKADGGIAKSSGLHAGQEILASATSGRALSRIELNCSPTQRLWLLYRSLLL